MATVSSQLTVGCAFTSVDVWSAMEEEEHTDRKQQLAMLCQKLNKLKQHLNEGKNTIRFT